MRVFTVKSFARWARERDVSDAVLWEAALEVAAGRYEASLGGFLYKKRIARRNQGKSGGYRTIIAYKKPDSNRIFFVDAFAKNEKPDLSPRELSALSKVAPLLTALTDRQVQDLMMAGDLFEVKEPRP